MACRLRRCAKGNHRGNWRSFIGDIVINIQQARCYPRKSNARRSAAAEVPGTAVLENRQKAGSTKTAVVEIRRKVGATRTAVLEHRRKV